MVLLALAGAAAASATANTFSYNRDGWMNDVQVRQCRRYQRQQVRLSQANMFREDIRDLAQASVTKLGNFVVIETLVFGMIAECYLQGPLPDDAAEFLLSTYMLCMSSSMIYMVMSMLCAIWAQHLSSRCQNELLTTLVRLPVEEFEAEIEAAAEHESVEAFEHQSLSTILRLPGLSRLGRFSASSGSRASPAGAASTFDPRDSLGSRESRHARDSRNSRNSRDSRDSWDSDSQPPALTSGPSVISFAAAGGGGATVPQLQHSAQHFQVFQQKEKEWNVLGQFAFLYGALGVSQMLQGYGYFATSKFYEGSSYASAAVQFVMVAVDAILNQAYMQVSLPKALMCAAVIVAGPASAIVAIRVPGPMVRSMCVLLCFSSHLLRNGIGFSQLVYLAANCPVGCPANCPAHSPADVKANLSDQAGQARQGAATQLDFAAVPPRKRRWGRGKGERDTAPAAPVAGTSGVAGLLKASGASFPSRRRSVVLAGGGIVLLAWLAALLWSLYIVAAFGTERATEMSARRLAYDQVLGGTADAQQASLIAAAEVVNPEGILGDSTVAEVRLRGNLLRKVGAAS